MLRILITLLLSIPALADEGLGEGFRELYAYELQERNVNLTFEFHTDNQSSLAYATTKDSDWKIVVNGGYFNWPQGDGALKLLICHELGHLFQGATRYTKEYSIEGVADFFAGYDCAKRIFTDQNEFLTAAEDLTRYWWLSFDSGLRGPEPRREQKSSERLTHYIEHYHHEAQCRLDIMTAGFSCTSENPAECRPACWLW